MLGHSDYKFDPQHIPAMSGKETKNIKSRFGLPREKVRKFMSLLKPRPIHWRKIPAELYVWDRKTHVHKHKIPTLYDIILDMQFSGTKHSKHHHGGAKHS